jgi:hypothetical protein
MFPPRAFATIAFAAAIAFSLFAGAAIGFKAGEASARIDFCADSTSSHYIQNQGSRSSSCD